MDPIPVYLSTHPLLFLTLGLASMAGGLAFLYGTWHLWDKRDEKVHDAFTFVRRCFDAGGAEIAKPLMGCRLLIQATAQRTGTGFIFQTNLETGAELDYKGATREKVRKRDIDRASIAVRVERDRMANELVEE